MSKEQIEEMSAEIREAVNGCSSYWSGLIAERLYSAGYRKQSEGEWETICHLRTDVFNAYSHICSKCEYFYKDFRPVGYTYCPNCGAKMKGGE